MDDQAVLTAVAVVVAIAWLPILLRFFRSWRQRNNPISFAICMLVFFALYVPTYVAATFPTSWPVAAIFAVDAMSCLTFYGTFWLSNRRFPDTRRNGA